MAIVNHFYVLLQKHFYTSHGAERAIPTTGGEIVLFYDIDQAYHAMEDLTKCWERNGYHIALAERSIDTLPGCIYRVRYEDNGRRASVAEIYTKRIQGLPTGNVTIID